MKVRNPEERCEVCGSAPVDDGYGNLHFGCKCGKVVDERDTYRSTMRIMEQEYIRAIKALYEDAKEALGTQIPLKRFKCWEYILNIH